VIGTIRIGGAEGTSPLGRTGPLAKLIVAIAWLVGLALTLDPRPPIVVATTALLGGVLLGRIPTRDFLIRLSPLAVAALGIGLFNALSASAIDPSGASPLRLGPLRFTETGALAGLGLGLRVLAIGAVGVAFVLTTDATRLVDALVQVARLPERFAYGALAAYQTVPLLLEDLVSLQQARRVRGLRTSWHPGVLVGLLILAVRRADRLALAMDARAFGVGPRSRYRVERWTRADTGFVLVAALVLLTALSTGRL
jgi:energy-coupling factor transport system permease protein